MEGVATRGILSLLPVVVALLLAFRTKDAVFSLVIGCLLGVLLAGFDPATGLSKLFQNALGTPISYSDDDRGCHQVMIAFYLRSGVIGVSPNGLRPDAPGGCLRVRVALGIFIFFSDYFSLFSGPIARP